MSTDWSTNNNKQFGKNELYLNMSNTFASIGLKISDSETIEEARNIFYNIYKRHNLCDNNGKWYLFDRYQSSNDYTGNKIDNIVVLNSAIEANISGQLYDKDNSNESINNRKNLIEENLNLYKEYKLCNDIILTGLFPHLDIVNEIVGIYGLSGTIPCWELGEETFYAKITYCDSCHIDSDLDKIIEPVPNLVQTKYVRNTLVDLDDGNAEYLWSIVENNDKFSVTGSFTEKTFKISALSSNFLNSINLKLDYSE